MIILLFILWIILNGRFTLDWGMLQIVITGLVLVGAITLFAKKSLGYKFSAELRLWKKLPLLTAYTAVLLKEIVSSSLGMMSIVVRKKKCEPVIIKITPQLKTPLASCIFANSVTLTPGTITADIQDDCFTIHCIDKSFAEGIEDCQFIKLLKRIEK